MKIYEVGGAVRDELLGLPVQDRDWVVVGATPEQMVAAGYRPVGRDFPVFLHPGSHDEYALARTERKVAPGYAGFHFHAAPTVTLEEDLRRRDLTINAMAREADGSLIDPHGGQRDLRERVLRHVSEAFEEDPVRVLRLARFAARFHDFTVAPETIALMRMMVDKGEVDALVPERCWQELSRGLMERHPSRMFEVLRACGALARVLPEIDRLWGVPQRAEHHPEVDTGVHTMMVLDHAAAQGESLGVRFAALTHDLGKGLTPRDLLPRHVGHEQRSVRLIEQLCERVRTPAEIRELARLVAAEHGHVHASDTLGAAAVLRLLERADALRKPARFEECLRACEADHRGRLGLTERPYPQADRLRVALRAARAVDAGAIASAIRTDGPGRVPEIKASLQRARGAAIDEALRAMARAPSRAGTGHQAARPDTLAGLTGGQV